MADWAGFLAFATRLALEDGEAELRSAISRAYYSAYNDARRCVSIKEPTYSFRDADHAKVWDWFASQAGQVAQVATLGGGLRRKRNQADYDASASKFLKQEAADALVKARRILALLELFRSK